ncbi:MAG: hypothetical protein K5897_12705 [Eubacterium sp.]|nr:hypothetical protein [Eubacterium sp.]
MARLFIKAQDLEEYDTVKVFNDRGKQVYYTKDDFIATGHRIKIFMAETISECAYVQEKYDRLGSKRFEFASRDKFGTIERDPMSRQQRYIVDFEESWEIVGDAVMWNYIVYRGALPIMRVRCEKYIIPGQALSMADTYILEFDNDSEILIGLTFALAVYALNKYRY